MKEPFDPEDMISKYLEVMEEYLPPLKFCWVKILKIFKLWKVFKFWKIF